MPAPVDHPYIGTTGACPSWLLRPSLVGCWRRWHVPVDPLEAAPTSSTTEPIPIGWGHGSYEGAFGQEICSLVFPVQDHDAVIPQQEIPTQQSLSPAAPKAVLCSRGAQRTLAPRAKIRERRSKPATDHKGLERQPD